ncbi:helix-turn-helix domain-containing protein [Nocardioides sp. TRM66260-LWL]|uniref:helix-turn-helix domain-containing protein n=1 Tax=Nocardioides sp. TRM66260-LWL TaxID=2874478 RepID=UPI001CC565B3|nr:helix-turn-helix transcriptional regulator [Nocardioides sp. TRM66260-LWL]MBZ5733768.1 helix-turn-helix domain-containing protein [Nocardioides sp. TRM66260-LWL]
MTTRMPEAHGASETHEAHRTHESPGGRPGGDATSGAIEVRRHVGVSGAIGGAAGVVGLAYLIRAISGGPALDWLVLLVLAGIAALHLRSCWDARAPLAVADDLGIRVRTGADWHGLPWERIAGVEVLPRRRWRDGSLDVLVAPGDPALPDDGLEPLAVPLTLATRVVGAVDLVAGLDRLAAGRTPVVEIAGYEYVDDAEYAASLGAPVVESESVVEPAAPVVEPVETTAPAQGSALEPGPVVEPAAVVEPLSVAEPVETPHVEPARDPSPAVRAEVLSAPERTLHRPGSVDLVQDAVVWADRAPAEPEPERPEPVIGPQLRAARMRLGLGVDQLADRTRIRPHVIESIEVDDFAPCGGDFYARGHLRTLARVLGLDAAPLVALHDDRYADAPIDPRRVFEAELAGGAIRGTRGGPNWSVLTAAVMAVVLAWSIARLVTHDDPPQPAGAFSPAGSVSGAGPTVPVELTAAGGQARVVVRDARDRVVYQGSLAFGQTKRLRAVSQPIRVQTSDGSLQVRVGEQDLGAIGTTGRPAQATLPSR